MFKKILLTVGKLMDNMTLINTNSNRDDFMEHGLHLNTFGKGRMAEMIGKHISQQMSRKEELSIIVKSEENQNWTHS